MARIACSPSRRSNLIATYGREVIDDEFFELRQEDGEMWPYCTLCRCWSNAYHLQGKKHARKRRRQYNAEPAQHAANNAAGQMMAIDDASASQGIPPPPSTQQPQLHEMVEDLQDRRVPELERQITSLQKQVEELRQVVNPLVQEMEYVNVVEAISDIVNPLVQHMADVNVVDTISDSGAAPNTCAELSSGSFEQPALVLRLRGDASK